MRIHLHVPGCDEDARARPFSSLYAVSVVFKRPLLMTESLNVYGWASEIDHRALGSVLGIPEAWLRLGSYLFNGFPEDARSRRDLIERRIEMFDAIPVGVDLADAAGVFCRRLIAEEQFGVGAQARSEASAALRLRVCEALEWDPLGSLIDHELQTAVDEELKRERDRVPQQWQSLGRVEPEVYETERLLETLRHACLLGHEPRAARNAAYASVFGANGVGAQPTPQRDVLYKQLFKDSMRR